MLQKKYYYNGKPLFEKLKDFVKRKEKYTNGAGNMSEKIKAEFVRH